MLGNTLNLILEIVLFVFLVEVLTDDNLEVSVELGTKEEKAIIGNVQSDYNAGIEEKDANDSANAPINNAENPKIETENFGEKEKKNTASNGQTSHEDIGELIKKFKEKRKPLWKIKDQLGKRQEPGFDLTLEEKNKLKIWKGGIIHYYIDVLSFTDKLLRDKIRNYLEMVNSAAGLNFIELPGPPSNDNERWVLFMNRRGLLGCADHTVKNFTTEGVQQVVLGYDCIETRGEIAEAVMSIAGVPAQHNAPDRDKYIQVNMENIMPDKKYLFEKLKDDEWLFHDLDYDFDSITHYDVFKYSANGRPTIQLKNEFTDLGLAKELSSTDLLKIKMIYNYITRNVKLLPSQCEKLFKPRSKFERFVPHKVHITPRKKPSRYSGTSKGHLSMSNKHRNSNEYLQKVLKIELEKSVNNNTLNDSENQKVKNRWKKSEKPLQIGRKVRKSEALAILSDYDSY